MRETARSIGRIIGRTGVVLSRGVALTLICAVVLMQTGCANLTSPSGHSTIRNLELTDREKSIASLSGDMIAVMELDFAEDIKGMAVYVEEWSKGEKLQSDLVAFGGTGEGMDLYISSEITKNEDGTWRGVKWNFIEKTEGTQITSAGYEYTLPEGQRGCAHSTYGESDHKKTVLEAGGEYILAQRSFDLSGRGVTGMAEDGTNHKEMLERNDYVNLVRLILFETEEEAEGSSVDAVSTK